MFHQMNHREKLPKLPSLKLTWPLKRDGSNTSFLLGRPIFRAMLGGYSPPSWTFLNLLAQKAWLFTAGYAMSF